MQKVKERCSAVALSTAVIFATLFSSCQSKDIKISGRFIGGDSDVAYLEEIQSLDGTIIDSVALNDNGEFIFNIKAKDNQHKLYNIVYDWSTIPLFAAGGDKININSVGNVAKNYTIDGSEESELVRTFYQEYIKGINSLDKIAAEYADEKLTEEQRKAKAAEYSSEYNRIKRDQLAFIIQNKTTLAAVYALYQRLPNDSFLFNGRSDAIYYRTVLEALAENYPESPYRKSIQKDIDQIEAFNSIMVNVEERGYPNIEMKDMYGEVKKLSDLNGKVILIDFWSAQTGNSNRNNADLKEIYAQYKDKGFEVYQVAVDGSKSTWINTIQAQGLPWISVCDFKGSKSPVLRLYNITALPTNFIVSRDGEIIARDIYGSTLEELVKAEVAK